MIRIPTGLFGLIGLLLTVLPTPAPASVNKPTAEERGACMGDALSLCIAAIPNKARIASCLASKMSQLSPRCRAQFDRAAGRQSARQPVLGWHRGIAPPRITLGSHLGGGLGPANSWGATLGTPAGATEP
jgi:hypothetical protein